ncbi:MAG: HlyD family efflux transporter periplasmic adaptor subunit [Chlorobiaceae bacterium]|nr:HlyD family efflux transporter periplasmic adaptor subunit [Chlorobiaceae bacterium]
MTKFKRHAAGYAIVLAGAIGMFMNAMADGPVLKSAVTRAGADKPYVAGLVEPIYDITMGFPVQGIVEHIRCREGQRVRQGDTLMVLTNEYSNNEVGVLKEMLDTNRKLFEETRSVSKEELERSNLEWRRSRETLRNRSLIAPKPGIVDDIKIEEGEICQPGQPVLRLVNAFKCRLVIHPEFEKGQMFAVGQKIQMKLNSRGVLIDRSGVVTKVSQAVDAASGLLEVKIVFDNADGMVRPGVIGYAYFPTKK